MTLDLFAGVPVTNYSTALPWYETLFGKPPAFFPTETEAVWEVAEHRFVYIVQLPERAGRGVLLMFVDDLAAQMAQISGRGIEPAEQVTMSNGVRKATYRDGAAKDDQCTQRSRFGSRRSCPRVLLRGFYSEALNERDVGLRVFQSNRSQMPIVFRRVPLLGSLE